MSEFDSLFARILGRSDQVYPAKTKHNIGKTSQAGHSDDKVTEKRNKNDFKCPICRKKLTSVMRIEVEYGK